MMRKLFFTALLSVVISFAFAQKEAMNWYFGAAGAISFATSPPIPVAGSAIITAEGSASISDANGQLLFYTDGISVWNKNNQKMPNGNQTLSGHTSSTQSAVVIPKPGSSTIYYVFTTDAFGGTKGFCYDIVDVTLDGGLGDVVTGSHTNLLGVCTEKLTAVKHCNGVDYWVLIHEFNTDVFRAYLVTSSGVSGTPVQSAVGMVHTGGQIQVIGSMKASPDGAKIGVAGYGFSTFELFDFNNNTGVVSNQIALCNDCVGAYGVEFSPNGNLVYVSGADTDKSIYQYNLQAGTPAAIIASKQSIAPGVGSGTQLGALQLAPDNKIYVAELSGTGPSQSVYLGLIDAPNVIGAGSTFIRDALYIGGVGASRSGLPNFIASFFVQSMEDVGICNGGTTVIGPQTVVGTSTYTWSLTTGFVNGSVATTPTPTVSPSVTTTYNLTVTTANSCIAANSVVVTVTPSFIANAGNDATICNGKSASIGAASQVGRSYSWSPTSGLNDATISNPVASPTITTTYIVTESNADCSATDKVIITVLATPTADAGIDKSVCPGNSTTIGTTAQANCTYVWDNASSLDDPTLAIPTASPTITTTYTVTVTNTSACSATDQVVVAVAPFSGSAGQDKSTCSGVAVTIGTPIQTNCTYQWDNASSLYDPTLAEPMASPTITTTYTVTVSNAGLCSATDQMVVTVLPTPMVNAGPNTTICVGGNTVIGSASISGQTYSWSPTLGLSNSGISDPTASPSVTTTYIVTVTLNTCVAFDTVVVTVTGAKQAGNDQSICRGSGIMIGSAAIMGFTYQWLPVAGLSDATVSNPMASPTITTTYFITATNTGASCQVLDTMILTVNGPLQSAGNDTAACVGSLIEIGPDSLPGNSYLWSPAINLSATNVSNPIATVLATTTYTLTVTDANLCTKASSIVLTALQPPLANAGNDTTVCNGSIIQIGMPPVSGVQYTWSPAAGLSDASIANPVVTVTSAATYTVTASDGSCQSTAQIALGFYVIQANAGVDRTICIGDSTTLGATVLPQHTYLWAPSTSLDDPTKADPIASPTQNTTYMLALTNSAGCTASAQVLVNVVNMNDLSVPTSFKLCKGDSIQLSLLGNAAYSYAWSPATGLSNASVRNPMASPNATTTYTVTATQSIGGGNSCTAVVSTIVDVSNIKLAVNAPSTIVACEREPITLSASSNASQSSFVWSSFSTYSDTLNTLPTDSVITLLPSKNSATYYVKTYNQYCESEAIVLYHADTIRLQADPLLKTCTGKIDTITVSQLTQGSLDYTWSPAQYIIGSANSNKLVVKIQSSTTYTAIAKNKLGCADTISVVVLLGGDPNPRASAETYTIVAGESTTLHALPASSNYQYEWHSADMATTTTSEPSLKVSPTVTTTYYLYITDLQNPEQCVGADTVVIKVRHASGCEPLSVFVPTAFTPNGDGNNDVLYVRSNSIANVELLIFNRWGEKIVEIRSLTNGWDGNYNGKPLEEGVYVYYIKYSCIFDDKQYVKKGNVSLIR